MLRALLCAAVIGAWIASAGSARAQVVGFSAIMNGAQETPPNASTGRGFGLFSLNAAHTQLTFSVQYQGLTGGTFSGAHFHNGDVGVAGAIVRGMNIPADGPGGSPTGSFSGTWASTDASPLSSTLVTELLAGRIYFNVHDTTFSGGEIRGQLIVQVPEPATLVLTGAAFAGAFAFRWRKRKLAKVV